MLDHTHPAAQPPKKVVILGAGFVGKALNERLKFLGIESSALTSKDLDLTAPDASAKLEARIGATDTVVFTAALTPDRGRDVATLMKNLKMAENLASFLGRQAVGHFIHISSDAVYDPRESLVRETTACHPGDLYSTMHVAREQIIQSAFATPVQKSTPLAILRPSAIYGAGDPHSSYGPNRYLKTALQEGKITLFGGGEEKRDHIHLGDVVEITTQVILHRSAGTLNLVSGKSRSFLEAAELVIQGLKGRSVELIKNPRSGPISHKSFDDTALIQAFPTLKRKSLEEGLALTVQQST